MITKIFTVISAILLVISLALPVAIAIIEIVIRVFFPGDAIMRAQKSHLICVCILILIVLLLLLWLFIRLGFKYPYLSYVYCAALFCMMVVYLHNWGGDIQRFYFDRKTDVVYKTACKKLNLTIPENTYGRYAIEEHIRNGNLEFVKTLLESGLPLNRRLEKGGFTLLLAAAFYGQTEIADYLVKQGADYNLIFNESQSWADDVMILSVRSGNTATVQLFLDLGVSVNGLGYRHPDCTTPLEVAAVEANFEMVKFLIANGADVSKVRRLVDNEEIRKYLIAHGTKGE